MILVEMQRVWGHPTLIFWQQLSTWLQKRIKAGTVKVNAYNEDLEQALEMLDLEWSKDNDTKKQCNLSNTCPSQRGSRFNQNDPEQAKP